MSFAMAAAAFKTGTGTSAIPVSLSLGGLVPQVIWCWFVGRTEALATDGVSVRNIIASRGFAVSTASRRVIAFQSVNGVTPGNVGALHRTDGVLLEVSTAGALVGRLDVTDMSTPNQVTLTPASAFSADYIGIVAAIAGTDIVNKTIFDTTLDTTTGVKTVSTPGFQASFIDVMSLCMVGAMPQSSTTICHPSQGRGIPSTAAQHVLASVSLEANPTDTAGYCNESEILAMMLTTGTATIRVALTGTDPTGWQWNVLETNAQAIRYSALALSGTFQAALNKFVTQFPADPGTWTIQPGFSTLSGLLTFSSCRAENAADTPVATAEWSMGVFVGPQNAPTALCQGFLDLDAVSGSSTTVTAVRKTDGYVNLASGGTVEGAVTVPVGTDIPGQLFLSESVGDAQQNDVVYVAFGPVQASPGGTAVRDMIDDRVSMVPAAR